jgi:hypothetical protein
MKLIVCGSDFSSKVGSNHFHELLEAYYIFLLSILSLIALSYFYASNLQTQHKVLQ